MRTLKVALVVAGLAAMPGLAAQADAASIAAARTHDSATVVTHRQASASQFETVGLAGAPAACDSILCPGYALIGVAF